MGKRSGIDLNTTQVVASMGAAVTGAILTSYLGNGGTIVGTAVGAGVSTAGFAIYKHYLVRTKEKVAPVIVEHARQWGPVAGAHPSGKRTAPGAKGAEDTPARNVAGPNRAGASGAGTYGAYRGGRAAGASADQTQPRNARDAGPGYPPGDARNRDFGQADTEVARPFGTVRMGSTGNGSTGNESPGGPDAVGGPGTPGGIVGGPGVPNEPGTHGKLDGGAGGARRTGGGLRGRPRWVVMVASAAAVFLIAILVITLIEFGTGKPLDATVWGRKASGTTIGDVTGSNSNSNRRTVTPTDSPTPTQSATPGGVGQTGPQPTSSATTAPTPSSVPSVSTAPSQNARASIAPTAPTAPTAPAQTTPAQLPPGQQVPGQQVPGQQVPGQNGSAQ